MRNALYPQKDQKQLRVLESHRPPQPNVGYIDQIIGDGESGIDYEFFSGSLRKYDVDVVHVHHPHTLIGGLATTDKERSAAAMRLAKRLKRNRTALVQTVHGTRRDNHGTWHKILSDATDTFIVLDHTTSTPDPQRTVLIPHAHYRDRFLGYPRAEQVHGRLLCLSPNRLVKVAAGPLKVFSLVDTPGLSLRVVGGGHPSLEALIPRVVARAPGSVSARMEPVSDASMLMEIDAAEIVMLPGIETLGDESMLYLALSLDRPVIVPDSDSVRHLAEQVGPGWIYPHANAVTAEYIDTTVERARTSPRSQHPDLRGRDMNTIAGEYAAVFREATRRVSSSRARNRWGNF